MHKEPKKFGPYTASNDLPPMKLLSQNKGRPATQWGRRFTIFFATVLFTSWMAYSAIANYCRFKHVMGLPAPHCTCIN